MQHSSSPTLPPIGSVPLGVREAWQARQSERLSRISERDKRAAMEQGEQITEIAAFVQDYRDHYEDEGAFADTGERCARAELGLLLNNHDRTNEKKVDEAIALAQRLPLTLQHLREGRITLSRARAILRETEDLALDKCAALENMILGKANQMTPGNLRRAVHRAVLKLDKDAARKRAQRARAERGISIRHLEHGMSRITIYAPAEQALAAFGVIDTLAKLDAGAGLSPTDDRGIDALRCDTLIDLVLNPGGQKRVSYQMRFLIPVGTALGLGDQDGHLPGYGPIPAALCRELLADATWKRILTDPDMSHVLDVGANTYAPSARMREYIEARDQHCRLPGCRRPAHHSEIDHTIEFGLPGGLTLRINLSALCKKHHKLKHLKGWDLIQDDEGCLIFITPTGQQYRTIPPTPLGEETPPERLTPLPAHDLKPRQDAPRSSGVLHLRP